MGRAAIMTQQRQQQQQQQHPNEYTSLLIASASASSSEDDCENDYDEESNAYDDDDGGDGDSYASTSARRTTATAPSTQNNNNNNKSVEQQQQQSSYGRSILELAIPAAGALLIDPLMTLADTAFVGHYAPSADGANQLAGMGSASAILMTSFYLFNFLCTATTPLVSSKRAAGREQDAVAVAGQALSLALALGWTLTCLLFTLKQPLLRLMGTGVAGTAANGYGLDFLAVRAFAAPAVLSISAASGILRGYLDTKTTIVVLIATNLVNLVLDIVLITFAGLGPLGAAIATTTAEWLSAIGFLLVLGGQLPAAAGELGRQNHQSDTAPEKPGITIVPLLSIPSWKEVQPLVVASSAVFFRTIVLQLSLLAAAAMAARGSVASFSSSSAGIIAGDTGLSSTSAASIAAHQISIQLWLLCSFFCDSLAAASQGLVADGVGRNDGDGVREVARIVFTYSLILGLFLAAVLYVGESSELLYDLFTEESSVRTALSEVLPLIILAQPLNAVVFAADGVLQGASEFPYQAKAMFVSVATGLCSFVVLETLGPTTPTLVHIWYALIILQLMRGLTSLYKLSTLR